jgi:outer membrane protein assembly factor BamB
MALPASAVPGDRLWIKRFAGSRQHEDRATAMAISSDGRTVFVTGAQGGLESATVAYAARSGRLLWAVHHVAIIEAISAAPNGHRVFITGFTQNGYDFFTAALDADTGAALWTRRYTGPNGSGAAATGIALSPDGSSVFVTGSLYLSNGNVKGGTVAYSSRDGATLWSARWDGLSPNDVSERIVAADSRVRLRHERARRHAGERLHDDRLRRSDRHAALDTAVRRSRELGLGDRGRARAPRRERLRHGRELRGS